MALLIRNARALDPSEGLDDTLDILIDDGIIREIGRAIARRRVSAGRLTQQGCW